MSQNIVACKVIKKICEAFGSFAEATKSIQVQIGKQGTISLHLCQNCVAKFQDD